MKNTHARSAPLLILLAVAIITVWILFNWQALLSLHARWLHLDEAYAAGYPAVLLSLWWGIRHRQPLMKRIQLSSNIAALLLIGALLVGVAARLVQLQLLQQLAALASLWLIPTVLLGWSVGRLLLFPAALLLLEIPLWDFLVDPLRALTVLFSQHMLDWVSIPAHVDGFTITLPSGVIEVAGGCSGLNLFLAMLLVGLLFAESHYLARRRRVMIVILAAIVGMIDNWVRVFLLVVIAHSTQMQSDLVYHHGNFGWWIFGVSLLPYFWMAARIERGGEQAAHLARTRVASAIPKTVPHLFGMGVFLVALISTAEFGARYLEGRHGRAVRGFATPTLAVSSVPTWTPKYSGQDVTQAWRIQHQSQTYEIQVLTYLEQRADKKLIYFSNRIADEREAVNTGRIAVTPDFSVNTAVLDDGEKRYVWWFWWVDGNTSVSALKTKLLQLKATLFGDPSAALVVLSVACHDAACSELMPEIDDELRQMLMNLQQLHAEK